MNTILGDIERLFEACPGQADANDLLTFAAELLPGGRPALVFLAEGAGAPEMVHAIDAQANAGLAREAAGAIRAALTADDCCCLAGSVGGMRYQLVGVRLFTATPEFLGGLAPAGSVVPEELRRAAPALRACARLALAAGHARRENRNLHTRIRHLDAEQEMLRAAHTEATVSAIEEQDKRLREEQQLLAMEQACAATEAANRAKSQFLANMSHEIRTPLNAILGFAELLRNGADGGDEQERRDYVQTIYDSANHLLELINDVLDLSKIESGRMQVDRIRYAPLEILASVLSIMRARAREKGLELSCSWPDGIPATISTDPLRLKQLLMNLVGNAVKFTQRGSVRLVCRLAHGVDRPQMAFDVIDTGTGIAADKLECIFDAFVQADSSVTREFGGTGLGLAISRRIARALGGDISVQSEWGRGSTFTATVNVGSLSGVPFLPGPAADGVLGVPAEQEPADVVLPPCCVLLVEDGKVNRKLISLVLERAGVEVVTAENGQQGVDRARERSFDLILMDMQMPIKDGYTATRELRAMGVTIPIVALTAHALSSDEQKCLQAGCSGYLPKPVNAARLLRTMADAMASVENPVQSGRAHAAFANSLPDTPPAIVSSLPADDSEFRQIILDFVAFVAEKTAAFREAWQQGDLARLAFLAHALKGTAGCAGFDAFTEPAQRLEQLAKHDRTDDIPLVLAVIEDLAARIVVNESSPGSGPQHLPAETAATAVADQHVED